MQPDINDIHEGIGEARNMWALAVNNHGGFGRWAFVEISDLWDAENTIRAVVFEP